MRQPLIRTLSFAKIVNIILSQVHLIHSFPWDNQPNESLSKSLFIWKIPIFIHCNSSKGVILSNVFSRTKSFTACGILDCSTNLCICRPLKCWRKVSRHLSFNDLGFSMYLCMYSSSSGCNHLSSTFNIIKTVYLFMRITN